jgi:hypothetical protein
MSVRTTLPVCRTGEALSAYVGASDVAAILACTGSRG